MKMWWANPSGVTLFQARSLEHLANQDWEIMSEPSDSPLQRYQQAFEQGQTVATQWPLACGKPPTRSTPPGIGQCLLSGFHIDSGHRAMLIEVMLDVTQLSDCDLASSPLNRRSDLEENRADPSEMQKLEEELSQLIIKEQQQRAELKEQNQKLKEEMLERERSQQFLQLIMDNIPQAIFWKDCDLNYLGCNKSFLEDGGMENPQDIIGKCDYDMPWTKEESDWFRACDRRVIETDTPEYHIIETQLRADGAQTWLDTNKIPLHDESGKVVGILGTYEDITDRKKAEAALEHQIQREQLLREITQEIRQSLNSQKIFQTAVNRVGQTFNVSRCHIHCYTQDKLNQLPIVAEYLMPGCDSMLGVNLTVSAHAEQLLSQEGAIASDNVLSDPLLQHSLNEEKPLALKSMLAVRTSYRGQANGAIVLHHCDRPLTREEFNALPKLDQDQLTRQWTTAEIELLEAVAEQVGIALAQAAMLEIEKRQRRELVHKNTALQRAIKTANLANQAKTVFLGSMSHELRTPLNGILGYSQLLKQTSNLPQEHARKVEGIHQCGTYLLDLIDDLMDLSTLDIQTLELFPTDIRLPNFLQSLANIYQTKAQQKGIHFAAEFHPDLPLVIHTDGKRLRQVLTNIIDDIFKHTGQGCVTLRVNVLASPHQKDAIAQNGNVLGCNNTLKIQFQIQNTSSENNLEALSKVFLPTEQAGEVRLHHKGVGLGLAISQKITALMGGEIRYSNKTSEESLLSIVFEFPAAPIQDRLESYDVDLTRMPLDNPASDSNLAQELILPPIDTLERLYELAQKGLIYDLRDLIQSIQQSDDEFSPFCQEISTLLENYRLRQVKTMLREHLKSVASKG